MPELPEVETMRRGITALAGSTIQTVRFPRCQKKPIDVHPSRAGFKRQVAGKAIATIDRIGKRVLLRLAEGGAVVLEPRMTGLVLLADPPTTEHLRVEFELAGGPHPRLLYWDRRGLGKVHFRTDDDLEARYGAHVLGPDALDMTADLFRERLGKSRRPIKVALLDQQTVAGIGNLYASEMLHVARIDPTAPAAELTPREWARLAAANLEVLHAAIAYEGSTLADGTYRNALNQDGGYQNAHRVYARAGTMCRSCGQREIERIVQAQRATFFCPGCQGRGQDGD